MNFKSSHDDSLPFSLGFLHLLPTADFLEPLHAAIVSVVLLVHVTSRAGRSRLHST
jgi:hypothetical protein